MHNVYTCKRDIGKEGEYNERGRISPEVPEQEPVHSNVVGAESASASARLIWVTTVTRVAVVGHKLVLN